MKFLFQMLISPLPLIILLSFARAVIFQLYVSAENLPNNETVTALIVFGDSIVDPGNNNYMSTIVKCNFPPYGRDFGGGNQPTGRFSNGLIPSDIIAATFGVKKLLPAYPDPNLQLQDLLTGVSFASGGAGEYKEKIREAVGESRMATIISNSIYIVCAGSDDIANTYFQTPFRIAQYDIPSYTDLMASQASNFLELCLVEQPNKSTCIYHLNTKCQLTSKSKVKELYGLGARRIGVLSLPNTGCVPSQRTIGGGIHRACSDSENQAAILFNTKILSGMDVLEKKFPEARFVYLDIYSPLQELTQNPDKYGFEVADKGCCGRGNIEVSILCNPYSIKTCSNASKYIFWDSYHPTEEAYKLLTPMVLDNKIKDFF